MTLRVRPPSPPPLASKALRHSRHANFPGFSGSLTDSLLISRSHGLGTPTYGFWFIDECNKKLREPFSKKQGPSNPLSNVLTYKYCIRSVINVTLPLDDDILLLWWAGVKMAESSEELRDSDCNSDTDSECARTYSVLYLP